MLDILNNDAWAAIGQHLDPISLCCLASICMGSHKDISSNSALWRGQAQKRWPALFSDSSVDTITNWYKAYHAVHKASCELATQRPWTASVPNLTSCYTPRSAHVLLVNNLHQTPARLSSSSSSSSSSKDHAPPAWHSFTCVAAAFGSQLHFWRWSAQADLDPPFVGQLPGPPDPSGPHDGSSSSSDVSASPVAEAAATTAAPCCWHWFSDSCHNNRTGPVSVLMEVSAGSLFPGIASGSVDGTVKLWTPFSSSSSSTAGKSIRPCRTLTSHSDRITAMACLTPLIRGTQSAVSSSSGSGSTVVPTLVSGSADKTIKLWSLASIQQPLSSAASSSGSNEPHIRQGGKQQQQQHARNVLLGTLRGHSGAINTLLPWPDLSSGSSGSGSSSGSFILSGSRDCRVKLWDVSEGSRCCAATWRLSGACRQLLGGLDMPGCAVVLLEKSLQVLDLRVPSGGSAATQGVLPLPWGCKGIATAAARGSVVAAGGREGVRAWDLRMVHTNAAATATSSSGGGGSSRVLVSGCLPNKAHVSHLHLDSLKLVAACNRPKLHSAAGIAVWSLTTGARVELPSSCLSGISLHPLFHPYKAAAKALGSSFSDAHTAVQHLIDQLSDKEAEQAVAIRAGEVELPDSDTDSTASAVDALSVDAPYNGSGFGGGSVGAAVGWSPLDESSDDYSSPESDSGEGELNAVRAARTAGRRDHAVAGDGASSWGCIEPGVLAVAVHGPVIACIDNLGSFWLRDFTAGVPCVGLLQSVAGAHADSDAAAVTERAEGVSAVQTRPTGSGSFWSGGSVAGATGSEGGRSEQQGRQAASAERCTTEADVCYAAEQLSRLKF